MIFNNLENDIDDPTQTSRHNSTSVSIAALEMESEVTDLTENDEQNSRSAEKPLGNISRRFLSSFAKTTKDSRDETNSSSYAAFHWAEVTVAGLTTTRPIPELASFVLFILMAFLTKNRPLSQMERSSQPPTIGDDDCDVIFKARVET